MIFTGVKMVEESVKILPPEVFDVGQRYGVTNQIRWFKVSEADVLTAINNMPQDYCIPMKKVSDT